MGFGNFLHGIVAQINPFDNGQTYGTFNPQQKKKQDDGSNLAPSLAPKAPPTPFAQNSSNIQIQTQKPQNLFQGLNNDLKLPGAPKNNLSVQNSPNNNPLALPKPGTVVRPQQQKVTAFGDGTPLGTNVTGVRSSQNGQQGVLATNKITGKTNFVPDTPAPKKTSFFGHVGNAFKTAGETIGGTVANAPEVGLAAGRAASGIVQGVTQLPHLVTAATAAGTQLAANVAPNRFTSAINRGAQDVNTGTKNVTNVVDTPLNIINRGLDAAAKGYAAHVPGASSGVQAYHATQIPLNVLAALVTGGASEAADAGEGANAASKASLVSRLLNRPLTSNADNAVARTAQAVTNKTAPVVQRLNSPISAARSGVTQLINSRSVPYTLAREGADAGEIGNVLSEPQLQDITQPPTQIPVTQPQPIEVQGTPGEPQNIPVTNNTPVGKPIVEVGGDRPGAVHVPTPDEVARQRATDRFNNQPKGRPDQRIEGVSPTDTANASPLFSKAQLQNEQQALDEALAAKEITKATHKAASDELAKNSAVDEVPKGQKINVKQVDTIPVQNQTTVPTDVPSTPGTVKATVTTAPKNTEAQAVANAPKVATPAALPKDVQNVLDNPKQFTKRTVAAARNQRKLARQYAKAQEGIAEATGRNGGTITVHSGGDSGFSTEDRGFAKTFADETNNGQVATRTLNKSDILDTRNADQRAQLEGELGKPTVDKMIGRSSNGLPNHAETGEQQALIDAADKLGYKHIALSETDKNTKFNGRDVVSYADTPRASVPNTNPGFVPSGEFRRGVRGNVSEVAHKDLEAAQGTHDTANLSVEDVLNKSRQELTDNGVRSPETVRNLKAIKDSGRFAANSPEQKAVVNEYKDAVSAHGRGLALTDRTVRTTASADQLTNRFTSKLLGVVDNAGKIKDSDIQQINEAENAFTDARDTANAAGEQFKKTGSDQDFKAWKAAQTQAETADRHAKLSEYLVAKRVLSGNKDPEATQAIHDAEKNAGVYSMDAIDANMLSGTGTMLRNYINTLFPRAENKLFGRVSSVVAKKLTGVDAVGGSSGRGARIGSSIGRAVYKADLAARKDAGIGRIRRAVTAGNTVGEQNIEATTYSKAFSHYKQLLKDEGYTGKELNNRAEFNVRTDPDGVVAQYQKDTLQANALSGLTHDKKVENWMSDAIQKALANAGFGHTGQMVGRGAAKAVARVGLGFPTVVARSLAEGAKRSTLGIPEVGWSTLKFMKTGNTDQYAGELAKAMQHAGSGGSLILLGHALGKMGLISGAYPTDKATQAQWEAEGKQDNSIKIGGNWYSIPGYLGGFALPLQIGATTASGDLHDNATLKNAWSTILSSSPVDNIQSTLEILSGTGTAAKVKNAVTSGVRSVTPAGALVAEIAKMTDSTENDTTTKDSLHNILDSIAGGIPILNNKVNTIPKTDSYGNVLHNPNAAAVALGAQGAEQKQGTQSVTDEQNVANDTLQQLAQYGVTSNKNLMQLVDPKLAKQIATGQPLSSADVAKVQKAVTKGVSATEDNNWRQEGDYGTDKAALQAKVQLLNADPTTKPSELSAYQTQIKRDDVLQKNNISYDQLKQYESTTLSQWRSMGDPKSNAYDPATYQALWNIDQQMAKGGGSYNTKDASTQKYSAKKASSGSGSSKSFSSDFGKIDMGSLAPNVQSYSLPSQSSGSVPVIQVQRPNIVHSISSSG